MSHSESRLWPLGEESKINYFAPGLETEDERDPHNEGVKLSFYPDTRTGTARNPWHN